MKKFTKKTKIIASLIMLIAIGCTAAEIHWNYLDTNWGSLSADWATCGDGTAQSPIDIVTASAGAAVLSPTSLTFSYTASNTTTKIATVKNNGHTVQVDFPAGSTITINGTSYDLLQFHFHNESEHTVDGVHYPMEMHLVHSDANGNLAVVGVFLSHDSTKKDISAFLDSIGFASADIFSTEPVNINASINVYDALPALDVSSQTPYYSYSGSLTTPPCTEAVSWNVLSTPVYVTAEQAESFFAATHHHTTNRPVQALNGRTVTLNQ